MDIREIQRLHAQFSPDSTVIDLPRQLATLPAPAGFPDAAESLRKRLRLRSVGSRVRYAAVALAGASVVGMAGIGAASIYANLHPTHHAVSATTTKGRQRLLPSGASTPTLANSAVIAINATPARPVEAAPPLSASDFASAKALGLTAAQFGNSLKAPSQTGAATASAGQNSEAQLAAASPIHRADSNREARIVAPRPAQKPAASPADRVSAPGPQVSFSSKGTAAETKPAALTPAAPAQVQQSLSAATATPPAAEVIKAAHIARRHIARHRADTSASTDTTPSPATTNHSGSAEVQLF